MLIQRDTVEVRFRS